MEYEGNFIVGLLWGALFSVPLWIAIFGWVQLFVRLLNFN